MLVNGVDISMLEGWMIKINSNPSFFGKNMNRRWFKVGFVPGPNSEKKLVISYSTNKTAKDPRGWLYVEDVSGIYCRREMIEIVSPSRTLRLKGETAVEHRMWSDSLYKLCNPPPKTAPAVVATPASEQRQERPPRPTQRETKQVEEDDSEDRAQRTRRSDRERERERDRDDDRRSARNEDRDRESRSARNEDRDRESRPSRSHRKRDDRDNEDRDRETRRGRDRDRSRGRSPEDDDERDTRKRRSPSPKYRESSGDRREEQKSSRRSPLRGEREVESFSSGNRQNDSNRCPSEHHDSDDDSSEDDRAESPRPSSGNSSSRSLLVDQIKTGSADEANIAAQCKNIMSDSEEEDDENYYHETKDEYPEESPRGPVRSSTNALDYEPSREEIDNEPSHEEIESVYTRSLDHMTIAEPPSKRKNSEYFDSDDEENEQETAPPLSNNVGIHDCKVPISSVAADNNFAHDDWDEEEPTSSAPTSKNSFPHAAVGGGVAADTNFAHDDWDD